MKLYKHTLTKVISLSLNGKLAPQVALQYSIALFRALAELHSVGIVISNPIIFYLMTSAPSSLLILVFLFKSSKPSVRYIYVQKEAKGTFNYMCPELFDDGVEIDGKVDVWAGTCCIAQMITGVMPFIGSNSGQIMKKVCTKKEIPPEAFSPDIPPNIKAIIHQCMQFDPKNRPTASSALTELEKLVPSPVQAITSIYFDKLCIFIHSIFIYYSHTSIATEEMLKTIVCSNFP